ncbi:MAG: class I SAM-dependent methyltransferase [bacterium]|nr:class I SAM-dependent methyltransferase [bacterium]
MLRRFVDRLLEHETVYRLWQGPFVEGKLDAVRAHTDLGRVRRVLDVGCGPGSNTPHFHHADYTGLDVNPRYTAWAAARYGPHFVTADAVSFVPRAGARFDCILVNSFLHHVDTDGVSRILRRLAGLLDADGHVHVIDLVLPERSGLPRLMARLDRGRFPRPLAAWRALFAEAFEPVVVEPFPLGIGGVTLWELVYLKGRPRT